MSSLEGFDILELPQNWRVLRGQRYRRPLRYVAQAAIWIGYVFFGCVLLVAPVCTVVDLAGLDNVLGGDPFLSVSISVYHYSCAGPD